MTPTEQRRAEFEDTCRELFGYWCGPFTFRGEMLGYEDQDINRRWRLWQAAADLYEREGMERAREICKRVQNRYTTIDGKEASRKCADAIEREMKGGDANA